MKLLLEKWPEWIDPERVFSACQHEKSMVFLDSHSRYGANGRWSVIASRPYASLRAWPDKTVVNGETVSEPPLVAIKSMLQTYRLTDCMFDPKALDEANCRGWQDLDLPIMGGCAGALAYEAGLPLAGLDLLESDYCPWPWISFDFYDQLIVFDLKNKKVYLQVCGMLEPHEAAMSRLKRYLKHIKTDKAGCVSDHDAPLKADAADPGKAEARLVSKPQREAYMRKIDQLREWIAQGEVYIANFTGQLRYETSRDSVTLYRQMRAINPAPFAAFMRQDDCEWMSSSPERFLQIRKSKSANQQLDDSKSGSERTNENRSAASQSTDGDSLLSLETRPAASQSMDDDNLSSYTLETRPIKGTRPRGSGRAADEAEKRRLLSSEKDRSELLMIVDLERNDISRVCMPRSVRVEGLFELESYPTVHHLVATVRGELRPDRDAVDAMAVCFPGGSITGAPKMRAMELIRDLEKQPRGYYTGCLGYFSADGQADFNILIRTLFRWQNGPVSYGAGGGITWESDPASEYQEMLDKAAAFIRLMRQ